MLQTIHLLEQTDFPAIRRRVIDTVQVNLGYLCNQSCVHCHVNAGPSRTELMTRDTVETLLEVLRRRNVSTLDLTGGAPEMNPEFRYLVCEARQLGIDVIDRCNLTILLEPDYADLAEFLAEQGVIVTASLPCYSQANVDSQRGKGVFNKSIEALRKLNDLGYGRGGELKLNLVYNPIGANLPPPQEELKSDYTKRLYEDFAIVFDELYTITNMPISRFGSILLSKGQFDPYMQLLRDNYSQGNLESVMCRQLVSVDWLGNLYDCDFNQMLGLRLLNHGPRQLKDLLNHDMKDQSIVVGEHCYGCTAGNGSSCSGSLTV
ncbi:MAG: arsenosugar biosynthesis radical SAM (seleno)protein ArsS [Pseudomonadota bacterium]